MLSASEIIAYTLTTGKKNGLCRGSSAGHAIRVIDYSQVSALHACHDLAWVASISTLNPGDPLWVRDLCRVFRALARNPNGMTRGAASTKSILFACGKHKIYAMISDADNCL